MSLIKGVLFDLFHTLVDVASAPGAHGRYTADILGVDRERWRQACFSHHHEIRKPTVAVDAIRRLAHSIDPTIDDSAIHAAAVLRQQRFDHALTQVPSDTLVPLSRLRASGLRLGLLSNASSGEVAAWNRSPLAPLFHTALFSCHEGLCKPEPAFYRRAAARLPLSMDEVLFVGDGGSDEHVGARQVGLRNVLVTRFIREQLNAGELAERRQWVCHEIHELHELGDLIARLNGA